MPKFVWDAHQKLCLFYSWQLRRRHNFWWASQTNFGPSCFVRALVFVQWIYRHSRSKNSTTTYYLPELVVCNCRLKLHYMFISITVSWLGKSLEQDTKHPKLRKSPFRPKEAFEPRILDPFCKQPSVGLLLGWRKPHINHRVHSKIRFSPCELVCRFLASQVLRGQPRK